MRGTDEEGALIVHCQHVMTQLKTLHTKTHHLLAAVHLGDSKWGADSLLFDERLALAEMVRLAPPLAPPWCPPGVPLRLCASPCVPMHLRAPPCTPSPGARLPCGRRGARARLHAHRGWRRARPLPRTDQGLPALLPCARWRLQRDTRVAAARHAGVRPAPPPSHTLAPLLHPLLQPPRTPSDTPSSSPCYAGLRLSLPLAWTHGRMPAGARRPEQRLARGARHVARDQAAGGARGARARGGAWR